MRLYAWLVGDWAAGAAALALPGAAVDRRAGRVRSRRRATGHRGRHRARARRRLPRRGRHPDLRGGVPGRPARDQPAADRRHRASARSRWPSPRCWRPAPPQPTSGSARCCWAPPVCSSSPSRSTTAAAPTGCSTAPTSPRRPPPWRSAARSPGSRPWRSRQAPLAVAGLVVLIVALGVRALPEDWRRGPVRGLAAGRRRGRRDRRLAGAQRRPADPRRARAGLGVRPQRLPGHRRRPAPGRPRSRWCSSPSRPPRRCPAPLSYDVGAVCAALATIGAPAAFGLPWWSPAAGRRRGRPRVRRSAAVAAADPRAGAGPGRGRRGGRAARRRGRPGPAVVHRGRPGPGRADRRPGRRPGRGPVGPLRSGGGRPGTTRSDGP